jgi:hypothetical protein
MAVSFHRGVRVKRRKFTAAGLASAGLCLLAAPARAALSETDAAAGIRAALERGAAEAVNRLGRPDGFLGNPKVRIPLPKFVADAAKLLRGTGQQQRIDELMTAMNRAAERAVPHARPMLISAVKSMSLSDARRILSGDDDPATQFFVSKTRRPLIAKFLPIVTEATQKVSLADKYNAVAGRAHELGLIKQEDADIQHYVTGKALDGLYYMIGEEERRIRKNPAATGSAILKKVFGSLK